MKIGLKVKTNDYCKSEMEMRFGKVNEIPEGIVIDLKSIDNHHIATVKLPNGRKRTINVLFLESI